MNGGRDKHREAGEQLTVGAVPGGGEVNFGVGEPLVAAV